MLGDAQLNDLEAVGTIRLRNAVIDGNLGLEGAVSVANPVPVEDEIPRAEIEQNIRRALADADARGVHGKDITPYLLGRIVELSGGASLETNIALVRNNARLGAAIAALIRDGLVLLGATFLAVGVFASSLTENQIVASIVTFGTLLLFWVIGWSADYVGGTWGNVLRHLSLIEHFDSFAKGVLDTKDIIYYLNFTALALFLALRSLESRRWSG